MSDNQRPTQETDKPSMYDRWRDDGVACGNTNCRHWMTDEYAQCCYGEDGCGDPAVASCKAYVPDPLGVSAWENERLTRERDEALAELVTARVERDEAHKRLDAVNAKLSDLLGIRRERDEAIAELRDLRSRCGITRMRLSRMVRIALRWRRWFANASESCKVLRASRNETEDDLANARQALHTLYYASMHGDQDALCHAMECAAIVLGEAGKGEG